MKFSKDKKAPVKPKEDPERSVNIEFLGKKITDDLKNFITDAVLHIRDEWRKELQDLRKEFVEKGVSTRNNSPSHDLTSNKAPVIDQETIAKATQGLDKLLGNISPELKPSDQGGLNLSNVSGGLEQFQKITGLIDLIKALKGLDQPSGMGNIGGQSFNQFIYREYLANQNMKDQVFNAVMKNVLKNSGMSDEQVKLIGDLNDKLMGTKILEKVVTPPKPDGTPQT